MNRKGFGSPLWLAVSVLTLPLIIEAAGDARSTRRV
jgi:hypothetical protein